MQMLCSSSKCHTSQAKIVVFHLLASLHMLSAYKLCKRPPAVFVFGDSIVDTGNNNYLLTVGKCDFPPYGRDFPTGMPTGRYSNGKVPSDFVVEKLGIKEFLPPYLNRSLEIHDLLTGVNFATGATGYDPVSAKLANVYSLDDQLDLFKEYKKKLKAAIGESRASTLISKSIYLIFAGSNDITNTYFLSYFRRLQYDIKSYTDLLVSFATSFYQELYAEGVRTLVVVNVPPVGCLPSQRTFAGGMQRSCVDEYNQAAILFNCKLNSAIQSVNGKFPGLDVIYLDVFTPLLNLINNPSQSGFEVVDKGCCGTGNIEVSFLCNRLADPLTCKDASKYIFWDSFHPTEAAYRVILDNAFAKNIKIIF